MQNEPSQRVDTTPAGPGAFTQRTDAPGAQLDGASEYEYVEILNPLSVTFIAQFGVTKPVNAPVSIYQNPQAPGVTRSEDDIRSNYGLNLKNPDHQSGTNIVNKVPIESGKTIRVLGNEAQVIVNQLVTEIMQRRGQRILLADPFARQEVEQEIIKSRGTVADILGRQPATVSDQLHDAINEVHDEQAFPEVTASAGTSNPAPQPNSVTGDGDARVSFAGKDTFTSDGADQPVKKRVGRPPKAPVQPTS